MFIYRQKTRKYDGKEIFRMSTFPSKFHDFVSELISYHKRFSSFQKIVIIFITVGVLSSASYKFLTVGITFIFSLLSSFKVSQYLIEARSTITFTETLWIYSRKYDFIFSYVRYCRLKLQQLWHDLEHGKEQKTTSLSQTQLPNKHENEVFHDPVENPNELEEEKDLINDDAFVLPNLVPQHAPPRDVDKTHLLDELELFVGLISRDFINDWYKKFSSDPNVLESVDDVLHKLTALICSRIEQVDRYLLIRDIILLYREHLYKFQTARSVYKTQPRRASLRRKSSSSSSDNPCLITNLNVEKRVSSIEEAFELKFKYHKALISNENEINYLRGVVQVLLKELAHSEIRNSKTPQHALDEIFTCNIFFPLLELFSGSDFLHECTVMLLSDEELNYIADDDDDFEEASEIPCFNKISVKVQDDLKLHHESDEDVFVDIEEENLKDKSSTVALEDENSSLSPHDVVKSQENISQSQCNTNENYEQKPYNDFGSEVRITKDKNYTSESSDPLPLIQKAELACPQKDYSGNIVNMETVDPKLEQGDQTDRLFFLGSGEYDNIEIESGRISTEIDRSISEEDHGGKTFIAVSIPTTEMAKEPRSSTHYTLYNIEYNAVYYDGSESPHVRTKTVKRRHREFINLQSRLEDNKLYSKLLKDIKGPKRWKLPFGNMDKSNIESRRDELEKYLRKLIEAQDICEGPELKEFLAYEDVHLSYFVKGASEMSVPRIDQMIVRTVSGVFDKIGELSNRAQEALPSLPGRKPTTVKDKEVKSYPQEDTDQIKVEFCTVKEQVLTIETAMNDYIKLDEDANTSEELDINLNSTEETRETTPGETDNISVPCSKTVSEGHDMRQSDGIELTKAIVDLAIQTLQSRDSWVCRERVIKLSQNLGGRVFNSWLKLQIDELTTEERCAYYLSLLRETIWPDGKLSTERRAVKTDRQKAITKRQAKKCLAEFFPDVLQLLVGEEDYNFSLDEIIESLQYEKLNRQFLFGLLDLLVERLFPETSKMELHQELQK